jgi:hypothetical protein
VEDLLAVMEESNMLFIQQILILIIAIPVQVWLAILIFNTMTCSALWRRGEPAKYCMACRGIRWPWKY